MKANSTQDELGEGCSYSGLSKGARWLSDYVCMEAGARRTRWSNSGIVPQLLFTLSLEIASSIGLKLTDYLG